MINNIIIYTFFFFILNILPKCAIEVIKNKCRGGRPFLRNLIIIYIRIEGHHINNKKSVSKQNYYEKLLYCMDASSIYLSIHHTHYGGCHTESLSPEQLTHDS